MYSIISLWRITILLYSSTLLLPLSIVNANLLALLVWLMHQLFSRTWLMMFWDMITRFVIVHLDNIVTLTPIRFFVVSCLVPFSGHVIAQWLDAYGPCPSQSAHRPLHTTLKELELFLWFAHFYANTALLQNLSPLSALPPLHYIRHPRRSLYSRNSSTNSLWSSPGRPWTPVHCGGGYLCTGFGAVLYQRSSSDQKLHPWPFFL